MWLVAGAATSRLITWTVYRLVLRTGSPTCLCWLRPYYNLQIISHVYDGTDTQFPLWIYLRNLWAYGRLTTLLLIPGLVILAGGSRVQRHAAIAFMTVACYSSTCFRCVKCAYSPWQPHWPGVVVPGSAGRSADTGSAWW